MALGIAELVVIILGLIGGAVLIGVAIIFSITIIKLLVKFIGHVFATVFRWLGDIFRLIGAGVVAVVFVPLVLLNVIIGRWSASAHFGRALTDECKTMGACLYRIAIGHPLHLIGLRGVTEGIEQRLPNAVAFAPGPDKPSKKRQGLFEGYTIVGSLPGGGSGGKLYVAEPDEIKRAAYARRGHQNVDRVVIKTFSLEDGSSLPQIVRESRALDAAKKLGLVLEHDLSPERFFYIMRYVPGDSLTVATQNLHARSQPSGLDAGGIKLAVGYTTDLLESLDTYHRGGLWHKDVKPDNLIVDRETDPALGRGRAHLVDFGLITPLRSAMTLTTHGTEYFRDPELVRQALRGVKVHQIDGGKFDVYAAGAVLFSIIENSFPAHGGLSQVSKDCPESIRWIIRRAMTDYDKRYPTARAMLDDLVVVTAASDPFSVKPADLPSMSGKPVETPEPVAAAPQSPPMPEPASVQAAASPVPPAAPSPAAFAAAPPAAIPKLRVSDWWTGKYVPDHARGHTPAQPAAGRPVDAPHAAPNNAGFVFAADIGRGESPRPLTPVDARVPAKEQLKNAKRRAAERRALACSSRGRRAALKNRSLNNANIGNAAMGPTARAGRKPKSKAPSAINAGIVFALLFGASAIAAAVIVASVRGTNSMASTTIITDDQGNTKIIAHGVPVIQTTPAPPAPPSPDSDPVSSMVPSPSGTTDGLDIALITDFRPPFDPAMMQDLEMAKTLLAAENVHTATSLFTGQPGDEDDATTLAEILTIRGQSTLDSETGVEISAYLQKNKDLDAVWLVGPGDDQPYRYLLIADSGVSVFETNEPRIADISRAMLKNTETMRPAIEKTADSVAP